jgi:acyl transferase domain-containing protein
VTCGFSIRFVGTGTPVGDPIEANSLGEFFKEYMPEEPEGTKPLKIGSVKTNIGHLESAAGVAGITKVLLMMKYCLIMA